MATTVTSADSAANTKDKVALITGITGQDGSYLVDFLLSKDYEVHGIIRHSSSDNTRQIGRLSDILSKNTRNAAVKLHYSDLNDSLSLVQIIMNVKPSEIYNLAAMSHVKVKCLDNVSYDLSEYTANVDALGTLRILEAVRVCNLEASVRFYQASTSELYGKPQQIPQSELTPFYPCSPYATAKLYAYWTTVNFREAYGMFAVNGILFNHESPRRGDSFVTRKIARAVAEIHLNQRESFELGTLDSKRDWGHARDFVEAMWLMLQHDSPEDFVIATGETHSVREFIQLAFKEINRDIVWEGYGINEVGKEKDTSIVRVTVDPKYFRPVEVDLLIGDARKANEKLKWKPKITFEELVKEMVASDIALLTQNAA